MRPETRPFEEERPVDEEERLEVEEEEEEEEDRPKLEERPDDAVAPRLAARALPVRSCDMRCWPETWPPREADPEERDAPDDCAARGRSTGLCVFPFPVFFEGLVLPPPFRFESDRPPAPDAPL